MQKHKRHLIGIGVVALAVGVALGAAGANVFQHTTTSLTSARGNFNQAQGRFAGRNGANGRDLLAGTVVSTGTSSITLNTHDGSSHIVLVTPDTSISKSVTGTLGDITPGLSVIISGTTNSDGSVSANLVQIRPEPSTP